ncbi:MAG: methylated-DNA--[protein]-cysteine S-methyltransferase [Bacteroidia bacterium]|nr:methylated-DNA--[protein]-cysteine S-methyltransferase [Bacteroidia bacterium]
MKVIIGRYGSPVGEMILGEAGGKLCLCDWNTGHRAQHSMRRLARLLKAEFSEEATPLPERVKAEFREGASPLLERVRAELDEYFAGTRRSFDIPLQMAGTPFQMRVWQALLVIPYGETRTYARIAQLTGNALGARAAAQAIGANGIGILIPCHRVIGSDRSLTGFAGGLAAKKALLELENPGLCPHIKKNNRL